MVKSYVFSAHLIALFRVNESQDALRLGQHPAPKCQRIMNTKNIFFFLNNGSYYQTSVCKNVNKRVPSLAMRYPRGSSIHGSPIKRPAYTTRRQNTLKIEKRGARKVRHDFVEKNVNEPYIR